MAVRCPDPSAGRNVTASVGRSQPNAKWLAGGPHMYPRLAIHRPGAASLNVFRSRPAGPSCGSMPLPAHGAHSRSVMTVLWNMDKLDTARQGEVYAER